MTETCGKHWTQNPVLSQILLENGYVIVARDGFPKFIEPAERSLVLRLLADRPREEAWDRFKMLRPAPETVTEAHLSSPGS